MKKLLYKMLAPRHISKAIRRLKELEYRLPTREVRFAIPFTFRGRGLFKSIRPRQTPDEILQAYQAICDLQPQTVLEIGTAKGGSLYLWCQAATDDALVISVDLPGGQFGGGYSPPRIELYQQFARPDQTLHLLREDSQDPATLKAVEDLLNERRVDFCFIDGDHHYPGVKSDFLQYAPLVRGGGVIGFHDIKPAPHDPEIEVHQLWDQLKERFETREIVEPDANGRMIGIGLLTLPDDGLPDDLELD